MNATERIKEIEGMCCGCSYCEGVFTNRERDFLLRALKVMREVAIFKCWSNVVGYLMNEEQRKHTQEETFPKWIDEEFNERMGKAE